MAGTSPVYKQRNPQTSQYYQCVEDHFETLEQVTCPNCSSEMKVISVIEDEDVIKKILKHLDLWGAKARPPPKLKKSS